MLSNIHQIRSFGVDVTYYRQMHSDLDEETIKKIQALKDNCIPALGNERNALPILNERPASC
jgi:hypothetical protein